MNVNANINRNDSKSSLNSSHDIGSYEKIIDNDNDNKSVNTLNTTTSASSGESNENSTFGKKTEKKSKIPSNIPKLALGGLNLGNFNPNANAVDTRSPGRSGGRHRTESENSEGDGDSLGAIHGDGGDLESVRSHDSHDSIDSGYASFGPPQITSASKSPNMNTDKTYSRRGKHQKNRNKLKLELDREGFNDNYSGYQTVKGGARLLRHFTENSMDVENDSVGGDGGISSDTDTESSHEENVRIRIRK